jgi:hypothetical protein
MMPKATRVALMAITYNLYSCTALRGIRLGCQAGSYSEPAMIHDTWGVSHWSPLEHCSSG